MHLGKPLAYGPVRDHKSNRGANQEMHPADELAAYLAANPKPDFSIVDQLWAAMEERDEQEAEQQRHATAA